MSWFVINIPSPINEFPSNAITPKGERCVTSPYFIELFTVNPEDIGRIRKALRTNKNALTHPIPKLTSPEHKSHFTPFTDCHPPFITCHIICDAGRAHVIKAHIVLIARRDVSPPFTHAYFTFDSQQGGVVLATAWILCALCQVSECERC